MLDTGLKALLEGANLSRLLGGLWISIQIAFISVLVSMSGGVLFGLFMTSKKRFVKILSKLYLESMRIIPILVWLFLFYFGFPKLTNIHLEAKTVSIFVFCLWGIAEMGDIVRGAVTSLPKHQKESGLALGLTSLQIYWYIIIPQALRIVVPSAMNLTTRMIKTTSLVVLIGVVEVVKVGQQIIEISILKIPSASFWVYGFIFFLYFIICYPVSLFSKKLEQKWMDS